DFAPEEFKDDPEFMKKVVDVTRLFLKNRNYGGYAAISDTIIKELGLEEAISVLKWDIYSYEYMPEEFKKNPYFINEAVKSAILSIQKNPDYYRLIPKDLKEKM